METQAIPAAEAIPQVKSPFQLLAAYSEGDRDKFFGRDTEIALLYQYVQEANAVLIYGESGTGKTSLVQCGLINETKHFNWTSITVRRIEDDINRSLFSRLREHADPGGSEAGEDAGVTGLLQEVFLHNFQPILLIFDQFEELFIFGKPAERAAFIKNIEEIFQLRIPWKMVFAMREDSIASLTEFDDRLPHLFKKRMRVELMNRAKCREVITRSCERFAIGLEPLHTADGPEGDTPDKIIEAVSNANGLVHPPYLQIFLDTLWKEARSQQPDPIVINEAVVEKVGGIGNVLKAFLEEKVNEQGVLNKTDCWKFLKLFVPESGTTRKKVLLNEYTAIPPEKLRELVDYLVGWKILSEYAQNSFELAHESLVPIIQGIKLTEIRPRLAKPTLKGNPYKGLQSFDPADNERFYGRQEAIQAVYAKVQQQGLVVIVGNSGAGKSSLIKAGLLPMLQKEGYLVLPIVRAGEQPLRTIDESLATVGQGSGKAFLLLIDQYEELITRISEKETRQAVYEKIYQLLEVQRAGTAAFKLKIIITVRADFEPQFRMEAPLSDYWKAGKYLVPPFSRDEIREVIEEPAYQAGLEFSPPSLVEKITEEVYSSQSTGLLPLMSFTLSELYKAYEESGRDDKLLTEEDYNRLGGVIGGLQNRADHIYLAFETDHPGAYKQYQQVMQNIILRMVYLSTGELAGQRVLEENLVFPDSVTNAMAAEVLQQLIDSHLVVAGRDNREKDYYEPAHDVLVKTWGQIWEWIGKIGRDAFFLRSRLAQAVNDYENTHDPLLLWNRNPWLESLVPLLANPQTGWLNKKETDFVAASKAERDSMEAKEVQEREEKLRLAQEKVAEQKSTIKREKRFRGVILAALIGAMLLGVLAFFQYRAANQNYRIAQGEMARSKSLNTDLQKQNTLLNGAKDSITKLAQAKTDLAVQERASREKADSARQLALNLVEKLNAQIDETIAARQLAEKRRDSLNQVVLSEKKARLSTDSVNGILTSRNRELDSTNRALSIQRELNTSQLLQLSRAQEQEDMGRAYRLAELAFKKAPASAEAKERYNHFTISPAYYYTRKLDGSLYKYAPDGKQLMVYDSVRNSLSLLADSTYVPQGVITVNPHLLSVAFSPDGKYLLLAYKNECEIRKTNNLADKNNFKLKENNIYSAIYSRSGKILVQTGNGLHLWKSLFGNEMPVKSSEFKPGSRIVSAYFTDDDKRIICNCENGLVYVWDPGNDDKKVITKNASFCSISPAGNFFLAGTSADFTLYNSEGRDVKLPDFSKNGQLVSVTFSAEGKWVVLSFLDAQPNQSMFQQKAASYGKTEYILVGLDAPRKDTTRLNRFFKGNTLITSYNGTLSTDNGIILGFEENNIVFDKQNGVLELLNVNDKQLRRLVVPGGKNPRAVSVYRHGNHVLAGGADNAIREMIFDYPANLDKRGLLPELTADDMQKYGVAL
ncbi:MAG: hypothetical protein INR73_01075 [Williamsia sp.]|nr:hypothetical protein [Williamsia sp.]